VNKVLTGVAMVPGTVAAILATWAPAAQAAPAANGPVAYVRDGAIYVATGATEKRLTSDNVNSRPRLSPDKRRLAYVHNGTVWAMNIDGSGQRKVSDRVGGGPAWSPDGRWIAFAGLSCTGGPGVYKVSSTVRGARSEVLFPASCRDQALPEVAMPMAGAPARKIGALADKLRTDLAVAWSPDGTRMAFPGGECENIADNCLTIGNVATGGEAAIAVYGGGPNIDGGFAVVPSWSPTGQKVAYTAYTHGSAPVHVEEVDASGANRRNVGVPQDREMVYASTGTALLTARHKAASWVMILDLATGKRTPFKRGSQPTV
jgi:Tol biopolymer transport system component